jgi:hypothetical protein
MICNRFESRDQALLITIGKDLWMQRVWLIIFLKTSFADTTDPVCL